MEPPLYTSICATFPCHNGSGSGNGTMIVEKSTVTQWWWYNHAKMEQCTNEPSPDTSICVMHRTKHFCTVHKCKHLYTATSYSICSHPM
eukprot:1019529-Pelagomonas_calceolata.AAC.2